MTIIINPGTEPIPGATEANAREAAKRFAAAIAPDAEVVRREAQRLCDTGDGRFRFAIELGTRSCEVDVPGCDPDVTEAGVPWESPRLYVDGSSWLWGYALNAAADALSGGDVA